jgi:hypothetical protein
MRVRSFLFYALLWLCLASAISTAARPFLTRTVLAEDKPRDVSATISAESTYSNSPHAVYRRFRQAMADQDWAAEYQCYTTEFQDHLLYRVVLLALHLEFDMDLFLQAEEALDKYGLTDADLEPFWPNAKGRVLVFVGDDPAPIEKWEAEIQSRMKRWSTEFRPRITDGAQLIAELQPLIVASGKRHPESAIARELETYGHHAFGRIRQLQMQGDDRAVGTIRTKTTNGYFISSPALEHHATGKKDGGSRFGVLDPAVACRLQSVDPNCYTEIWQAASELQMISDTLPKHRFAVIGMLTGDIAVELNESLRVAYEEESGEEVLTIDDFETDSEGAEFDLPNNGTRTVSESKVEFQRVGGRWLINEIDYR